MLQIYLNHPEPPTELDPNPMKVTPIVLSVGDAPVVGDRGKWRFRETPAMVDAVDGDFLTVGIFSGGARSGFKTVDIK